jgi:hypothetical protein
MAAALAIAAPAAAGSAFAQAAGTPGSTAGTPTAPGTASTPGMPATTTPGSLPAAMPEASHSAAGSRGTMALTQVQNAQQTLASAKLQGTTGQQIGIVQQVSNDANGTLGKILVKLDPSLGMGTRSVWIDADQLRYQPDTNAVTTTLSPEQLSTM